MKKLFWITLGLLAMQPFAHASDLEARARKFLSHPVSKQEIPDLIQVETELVTACTNHPDTVLCDLGGLIAEAFYKQIGGQSFDGRQGLENALYLYALGCSNGAPEHACHRFGVLGARLQDHTARETVKKTLHDLCVGTNAAGPCYGELYFQWSDQAADQKAVLAAQEKRCNAGEKSACSSWAYFLRETGRKSDLSKSFKISKKICTQDGVGCHDLAVDYAWGYGTHVDYFNAKKYLEIACKAGNPYSCENLKGTLLLIGGVYELNQQYDKAKTVYEQACKMDDVETYEAITKYGQQALKPAGNEKCVWFWKFSY